MTIYENDNISTDLDENIEINNQSNKEDDNVKFDKPNDASQTITLPNENENNYKQIYNADYVSDDDKKETDNDHLENIATDVATSIMVSDEGDVKDLDIPTESVGSVIGPMIPQIGLDGKEKKESDIEKNVEDDNEDIENGDVENPDAVNRVVSEAGDLIEEHPIAAAGITLAGLYGLYLASMDCIKLLEKAGDNIVTAVQYPKYAKVLNAYYKYFIDGKAPEFKSLHKRKTFTNDLGDKKNVIIGVLKKYGIGTECALVDYYEDKDEKDSVCGCYMEKKYKAHIDLFASALSSVLSDTTTAVIEYGWTKHLQPKVLKYKKYSSYYIAYMCLKLGFITNEFKDIMRDIKAELRKHKAELDKVTKESVSEELLEFYRNPTEITDVVLETAMDDASNMKLSVDLPQSLRKLCCKYSLVKAQENNEQDPEKKKKFKKELVEVEKELRSSTKSEDEKKGVDELKTKLKAAVNKEVRANKKAEAKEVKEAALYEEAVFDSLKAKYNTLKEKMAKLNDQINEYQNQARANRDNFAAARRAQEMHDQAVREHQRMAEEAERIHQQMNQQAIQQQQMLQQQQMMNNMNMFCNGDDATEPPFIPSDNIVSEGEVTSFSQKAKALEKRKNYWKQFKDSSEKELTKSQPREHQLKLRDNISRAIKEIKKIDDEISAIGQVKTGSFALVYACTEYDDIIGCVVTEYGFDEIYDKYIESKDTYDKDPTAANNNRVIGYSNILESVAFEIFTEARNMEDEIKPYVDKLNSLGFNVKYASPGHLKLRKKTDVYRDGIYKGKLYSDARIMFDKDYEELSNKKAPDKWRWRIVDGCTYLDVKDITFDDSNGTPDEAFKKWKNDYMSSLKEFIDSLENKDTSDKKDEPEEENNDEVKESVLESIDFMIDDMLN